MLDTNTEEFRRGKQLLAVQKALITAHANQPGDDFNLITLLRKPHEEVKLHSAMLAFLLDPSESHGLGGVLFDSFIERLSSNAITGLKNRKLEVLEIGREVRTSCSENSERSIDIRIVAKDNEQRKHYFVIENKIEAPDQPKQLADYYKDTRNLAGEHNKERIYVLYLTPHGDKPSQDSYVEDKDDYFSCISYKNDILPWLEGLFDVVDHRQLQMRSNVSMAIKQYIEVIQIITGTVKMTPSTKAMSEWLCADVQSNFDTAIALSAAISDAVQTFKKDYFRLLKSQIQKKLASTSHITCSSEPKGKSHPLLSNPKYSHGFGWNIASSDYSFCVACWTDGFVYFGVNGVKIGSSSHSWLEEDILKRVDTYYDKAEADKSCFQVYQYLPIQFYDMSCIRQKEALAYSEFDSDKTIEQHADTVIAMFNRVKKELLQ